MALRVSRSSDEVLRLQEEINSQKELATYKIALPISDYEFLKDDSKKYYLGFITMKADGSFLDVLRERKNISKNTKLIENLCNAIIKAASAGYICGDIKPLNILVVGDEIYMIDFDVDFCVKDAFLAVVCKKLQIPKSDCVLDERSRSALKKLYSRMMLMQLYKIIKSLDHTTYPEAHHFNNLFFERCVKDIKVAFPTLTNKIYVAGRRIPIFDIIRNVLGHSDYTKFVFEFYTKLDAKNDKEYIEVIGSLDNSSTPNKLKLPKQETNNKKKLGENCDDDVECYTKTCVNNKCVSKKTKPVTQPIQPDKQVNKIKVIKVKKSKVGEPCAEHTECYTNNCYNGVCVRKSYKPNQNKIENEKEVPKKNKSIKNKMKVGESCKENKECNTKLCVKNICERNPRK